MNQYIRDVNLYKEHKLEHQFLCTELECWLDFPADSLWFCVKTATTDIGKTNQSIASGWWHYLNTETNVVFQTDFFEWISLKEKIYTVEGKEDSIIADSIIAAGGAHIDYNGTLSQLGWQTMEFVSQWGQPLLE